MSSLSQELEGHHRVFFFWLNCIMSRSLGSYALMLKSPERYLSFINCLSNKYPQCNGQWEHLYLVYLGARVGVMGIPRVGNNNQGLMERRGREGSSSIPFPFFPSSCLTHFQTPSQINMTLLMIDANYMH